MRMGDTASLRDHLRFSRRLLDHRGGAVMSGVPWFSESEYDYWEAMSAFQKSIRRCDEQQALFWGTELLIGGAAAQAWARMLIICSEDIGLADTATTVRVGQLHAQWKALSKEAKADQGRLFYVEAILLLVRADKSRLVDSAVWAYCGGERAKQEIPECAKNLFDCERLKMPIPDWALDMHTRRGREMGRGADHFYEVGARLANCRIEDIYEAQAKQNFKRAKEL
jgi:replication-associated recombination protein RarA